MRLWVVNQPGTTTLDGIRPILPPVDRTAFTEERTSHSGRAAIRCKAQIGPCGYPELAINLRRVDNQLRALVVDDDEDVRALITTILRGADFEVVEAGTGEEALALARDRVPTLAVVEVKLPGLSGYEVIRRLRKELGETLAIMIISGSRTEAFDRAAGLEIGADDYMLKPFDPTEVVARARALVRRVRRSEDDFAADATRRNSALTPRELEVLRLLARGASAPAIANRLVVSPKTVAKHIERILFKLGVHSRTEAVAVTYRDGLIDELPAASDEAGPDRALEVHRPVG